MAGLDITPRLPAGRNLIQGYGDRQFRIGGETLQGSQIVFPDRTTPWSISVAQDVTLESLREVTGAAPEVRILLVGCGRHISPPPRALGEALRAHNICLEWMDTGAACRTFNVLLLEDREVAAALIAVD
ncbi:MAG: Mth938-like domain-containing protein [Hyphomicrobium sp.]